MHELTGLTDGITLATIFGAMGLLCQLTWPLFRRRRTILAIQFGIGADYGVHYALLAAWSGAGVACLGATQTAVAFLAGEHPRLRWLGFVFVPLVGLICFVTWSGAASLLAMSACILVMLGRMQRDTIRLRCFQLAAAPFGMGYDFAVGATPALMGAIVSATVAASALAQEIQLRARQKSLPATALPGADLDPQKPFSLHPWRKPTM
jgi:hypothetical protein